MGDKEKKKEEEEDEGGGEQMCTHTHTHKHTKKVIRTQSKKRFEDVSLEDQNDVVTFKGWQVEKSLQKE